MENTASKLELALKMVLLDAIEKGANQDDLVAFMASEACQESVLNYLSMIESI